MTAWAVFDLDGTLLPGNSLEQRFLEHVTRQGLLPFKNLFFYTLMGIFNSLRNNWEEGFKSNKMYLKDLPANPLQRFSSTFFYHKVRQQLSRRGMRIIQARRKEGFKIMLMSGSPDFLTRQLAPIVRPDYLIASDLEIRHRRYTGRLRGLHPYGIRKRLILQKLRSQLDIDFAASAVFANHHSDVLHMEIFGEPVAVNPTTKLLEIARARGWKIEHW